ncbi:uncharacterized protein LOC110844542 isoform X2 [Folsomia candida]|uniref:E3 ubiquitin-protein ligase RNF8 n=1 Tax=Folsomia candida TaxID=158441 RepID=A0A226ER25_FOLCA|nr:uncharacterized protein LOC110844542 isoform X2 [Folsomia candida]OXA60083.1 E3 ubiquitin-protein ligase RNF8 [Folsomia candida]
MDSRPQSETNSGARRRIDEAENDKNNETASTSTSIASSMRCPSVLKSCPESSSLVEIQLAKVSEKLVKLIKSSETKRVSIRNRLLNGELEPQFLALEHKVVAAENIRTLEDLYADVQRLRIVAAEDKELKENELKSQTEVFQLEFFKDVVALLETEFSCVICCEIFLEPAVIDCGHTFCSYCINEWKKEKKECPICRKPIIICTKHVEMQNFVTKIHTMMSQDIQDKRNELVSERENTIASGARQRPEFGLANFNEYLVQEINGFYNNVQILGREVASMDRQGYPLGPLSPPGFGAYAGEMGMRPFRLSPAASPLNTHMEEVSPFSSDDEDDGGQGEHAVAASSSSAFLVTDPTPALPATLISSMFNSPSTYHTSTNNNDVVRNSSYGHLCPYFSAQSMNIRQPTSGASSLSTPSTYHQGYPCHFHANANATNNNSLGYHGMPSSFYQPREEPPISILPQAAHANRLTNPIRPQQQLNQVPPPAHQNSTTNNGYFINHRHPPAPPLPQQSSSQMRPSNLNVTFNVTSSVVPNTSHNYGFIPMTPSREPLTAPPVQYGIFPHQIYEFNQQQRQTLFAPTMYTTTMGQSHAAPSNQQTQRPYHAYTSQPCSHTNVNVNESSSGRGRGSSSDYCSNNYNNTEGVHRRLGRRRRQESDTETEHNNVEFLFDDEDLTEVEIIEEISQEPPPTSSSISMVSQCADNRNNSNSIGATTAHTMTFQNESYDPCPLPPRRQRRNDRDESIAASGSNVHSINSQPCRRRIP